MNSSKSSRNSCVYNCNSLPNNSNNSAKWPLKVCNLPNHNSNSNQTNSRGWLDQCWQTTLD